MTKYYKVPLRSTKHSLKCDNKIVVKNGLIYVKDIVTNSKIIKCDDAAHADFYDCYVLNSDINDENLATINDVIEYLENEKYSFLIEKNEQRLIKRYIKDYKRDRVMIND